jgi:UDP-GlcNAc:undecaprenyl-phosphate GlcNAc-1-phosphate transferase
VPYSTPILSTGVTALAALAALPVSAAAIWALLRTPLKSRLVVAPTGDRWHTRETPLVGGIGIAVGFAAGVGAAVASGYVDADTQLLGILGGCAILFGAGLLDDLVRLNPLAKLGTQIGAAVLVLATGTNVEIVGNDVLGWAIGLLWLVGLTNAFNLLDNMDGLAASLAAIACAFFAIDAATTHRNHLVLALSLALALACAGFLPFNLRPGRKALVFMGDSGSQILGFALAALGLAASYTAASATVATLILPILILAVPILDTTLVTIVRLLDGRPIYEGGRDHSSHRLVYMGLSETSAVVLLALVSIALGATSLAYTALGNGRIAAVGVLITFALLVQFGSFLADIDREGRLEVEGSLLRRVFFTHVGRMAQVAVDGALITAAFTAAYLLRFEGTGTFNQRHYFLLSLPVLLFARYIVFIPAGLYRGVWRYAGSRDALAAVASVALSEVLAVGFVTLTRPPLGDFSPNVFVIDAFICSVLIVGSRFAERALARALSLIRDRDGSRIVIVGAGRTGRSLLRELRDTPGERVIGFVDDDPRLRGRRLQGIPVLAGLLEVERVLDRNRPDTVLVTIPEAPRERLDAVVAACEAAGVPCRFVRREVDLDPRVILGTTGE